MTKRSAKKIIHNLLSLNFSKVITSFFYFILTVYFARVLGVENFGKYEFSIAVFVFFAVFANFGMGEIGVRTISRTPDARSADAQEFANNFISLRFALSMITMGLLLVFIAIIPKSAEVKSLILLNGFTILVTFLSLEWFFTGMEKMMYVALRGILTAVVFLLSSLFLVRSPDNVLFVPVARFLAVFVAILFLLAVYARDIRPIRLRFNGKIWKELARDSYPLLVAALVGKMYWKIDAVMLGFLKGNISVGLYVTMYRIVLFMIGLKIVSVNALFPVLSRYYAESREKLNTLVNFAQKVSIMIAVPIGVGGMVLSRRIVALLMGSSYLNGVPAFNILIWSFVVLGISFVLPRLQIACNRQGLYMKVILGGALLNVFLNLLWIPRYGIIGAAWATTVTDVLLLALFYRASKDFVQVDIPRLLIIPILASAVMGGALLFIKQWNLFLAVSLGIIVYMSVIYKTKYFKLKELQYVLEAVSGK